MPRPRSGAPHARARAASTVHAEVPYLWRSADEDRPSNPLGVEGCPTRPRHVVYAHNPAVTLVRHVDPARSVNEHPRRIAELFDPPCQDCPGLSSPPLSCRSFEQSGRCPRPPRRSGLPYPHIFRRAH
jgi:hypothetical protein